MLDGTPLLDIKPYVPDFEPRGEVRVGWLQSVDRSALRRRSDDRFT
jgi:tRNA (Thr-GGU) A37 N-methylase